jgi:hypothetical protein
MEKEDSNQECHSSDANFENLAPRIQMVRMPDDEDDAFLFSDSCTSTDSESIENLSNSSPDNEEFCSEVPAKDWRIIKMKVEKKNENKLNLKIYPTKPHSQMDGKVKADEALDSENVKIDKHKERRRQKYIKLSKSANNIQMVSSNGLVQAKTAHDIQFEVNRSNSLNLSNQHLQVPNSNAPASSSNLKSKTLFCSSSLFSSQDSNAFSTSETAANPPLPLSSNEIFPALGKPGYRPLPAQNEFVMNRVIINTPYDFASARNETLIKTHLIRPCLKSRIDKSPTIHKVDSLIYINNATSSSINSRSGIIIIAAQLPNVNEKQKVKKVYLERARENYLANKTVKLPKLYEPCFSIRERNPPVNEFHYGSLKTWEPIKTEALKYRPSNTKIERNNRILEKLRRLVESSN